MAKVSIGLRGWRFDEDEVLRPDGSLKPLEGMSEDDKERILRLAELVDGVCDACWLLHGENGECNDAAAVYGEPLGEVLLCPEHEADFLYWYREAGGSDYRGSEELADAFHEWFLDGNRAPEGYAGIEHVETDPGDLPPGPDPDELPDVVEVETGERIDLREGDRDGDPIDPEELARADVDLDTDYPG